MHALVKFVFNSVQELSLDVFSRVPFQLPPCQSLITLSLGFDSLCILKLPTFADFSQLKSLHLWMVIFIDSSMLGNFISSCPLLENLNIEQSFFYNFKVFEICSTSLKNLIEHSGDEDDPNGVGDGLGNCEIKDCLPKTCVLEFHNSIDMELLLSRCKLSTEGFHLLLS